MKFIDWGNFPSSSDGKDRYKMNNNLESPDQEDDKELLDAIREELGEDGLNMTDMTYMLLIAIYSLRAGPKGFTEEELAEALSDVNSPETALLTGLRWVNDLGNRISRLYN